MKISLDNRKVGAVEAQALVSYVFEGDDIVSGKVDEIDQAAGGLLRRLAKSGEMTGKSLEMTLLHAPKGLAAERLLLVGAGKREKFNNSELRKLAGAALRSLKSKGVKQIAFLVRENDATTEAAEAVTEGLLLADFEGDKYKTGKKDKGPMEWAVLLGWDASAGVDKAIERGRIIAESQNFTRELANEPSNTMTPTVLADRAAAMAREEGLACEILDENRIKELKMGALLSVAQGSVEPPRLIAITYTPSNAAPGGPVLGLVGKAVTFDTGGISIKPAADMDKMKFDMCGGAAMIGVMRALGPIEARCESDRGCSFHRKYAGWAGTETRRRSDCHVRKEHRSVEYRRGRAADPGGRSYLCAETWLHASRGCSDAHRRDRRGAGWNQHRSIWDESSVHR